MKNYLVNKILDKYEKSKADWKDKQIGGRSIFIQQSDYDKLHALVRNNKYQGYGTGDIPDTIDFVTGKDCLIKEALWLKEHHLVEIKWQTLGSDIERIKYSLENITEFYRIAEREPKFVLTDKKCEQLRRYQEQVESDWLKQYYQDRIEEAEKGKTEKGKIAEKQTIKKIITVENKANFVSMPYEEGTLILFSHGFFSPLERAFLKQLENVLKEKAEYFHTGDLDYGGVRIFRYIREQIFPLLHPLYMSVDQYKKYEHHAIDIEESAFQKLKEMKEPLLQDLIDLICEKRKVIEQENFINKGHHI